MSCRPSDRGGAGCGCDVGDTAGGSSLAPAAADALAGQCLWDTAGLPEGTYELRMTLVGDDWQADFPGPGGIRLV